MTEHTRGTELAADLENVNAELIELLRGLAPDRWRLRGANAPGWDQGEDETRTVAQIALHTAHHHLVQMAIVRGVAEGTLTGPVATDGAAEGTADPDPDRDQVLELLARNGAAGAAMLRGLSGEQLANRMTFRGWTMSAEELAVQVLVGHVRWHLASIRATVDTP
jgi:hypothetical protein